MITVKATDRTISAVPNHPITSGSVGLPVSFIFSEAWDGLTKIAVFKGSGTAKDVALLTDECVVPAEVLEEYGDLLWIGVYGANGDGDIVMPTMWCKAGLIVEGTAPSESDPADPTPNWVAQVQAAAASALEKAEAVEAAAAAGDFDGEDGADGTTFTPSVASNGDLSWSNTDGKTNPATVNIKGPTGSTGPQGDPGSSIWYTEQKWRQSVTVSKTTYYWLKSDLDGRSDATFQLSDTVLWHHAEETVLVEDPDNPGSYIWVTYPEEVKYYTISNPDTTLYYGGETRPAVGAYLIGSMSGPKGDTGDTGTAATVTTGTTTTLAPGSYATVMNTGTSSAAVLNFGIPKGDKGDTGDSGVYYGTTTPTDPDVTVWIDPSGDASIPEPATATPQALGTAAVGTSTKYAREDHVHQKPTYSASDVGAVASNQGSGNSGKFLVVGSDGVVAPVTMTAWQGGNY